MENLKEKEKWLPVPNYEGIYEVSSLGRVKSLARTVKHGNGGYKEVPDRILKAHPDGKGYLGVDLHKGSKASRKRFRVHSLVAQVFIGSRPEGLDVCHNDGDKHNNWVENLRYDTRKENILDSVRHGTHHMSSKRVCKRGHTLPDDPKIRSQGCRFCGKAFSMTRYREHLKGREAEISDIYYSLHNQGQKRVMASEIESLLQ